MSDRKMDVLPTLEQIERFERMLKDPPKVSKIDRLTADLESSRARVRELEAKLRRLASPEAFTYAQSISGPLAEECRARMVYAQDALRAAEGESKV